MPAPHVAPDAAFASLETKRLRIRRFADGDLDALVAYRSDPEVARFQGWAEGYSVEKGRDLIAAMRDRHPGGGAWFQFAIEERATGALIGDSALLAMVAPPGTVEVGLTLAAQHQRKGFAREALTALLDYAFGTLRAHRVAGIAFAANLRSTRMLEALGFRFEGTLRESAWFEEGWADEVGYAVLEREWAARRATVAR